MKKVIIITVLWVFLLSCTNNKNNDVYTSGNTEYNSVADSASDAVSYANSSEKYSELLRTGEFFTAEQIEELKTNSLKWQSVQAGIGGFANITAIDPSNGSNQQVFISLIEVSESADGIIVKFETYEKIQIQPPEGTQARILYATSGAGSGELVLGYKFTTKKSGKNSEWIEIFYAYSENLRESKENKWENISFSLTEDYIEIINEYQQFE